MNFVACMPVHKRCESVVTPRWEKIMWLDSNVDRTAISRRTLPHTISLRGPVRGCFMPTLYILRVDVTAEKWVHDRNCQDVATAG